MRGPVLRTVPAITALQGLLYVLVEPIDDQVGDLEIVLLDHEDMAVPEYSSLRQDQRFRFATCVQQGLFGGMRLCCCVWIPIADDEQDRYLAVESDIRRSAEIGNPTLQRDNCLELVGTLQGAQPAEIS
jgi:hypothetical protein